MSACKCGEGQEEDGEDPQYPKDPSQNEKPREYAGLTTPINIQVPHKTCFYFGNPIQRPSKERKSRTCVWSVVAIRQVLLGRLAVLVIY